MTAGVQIPYTELKAYLGIPYSTVKKILNSLVKDEIIELFQNLQLTDNMWYIYSNNNIDKDIKDNKYSNYNNKYSNNYINIIKNIIIYLQNLIDSNNAHSSIGVYQNLRGNPELTICEFHISIVFRLFFNGFGYSLDIIDNKY